MFLVLENFTWKCWTDIDTHYLTATEICQSFVCSAKQKRYNWQEFQMLATFFWKMQTFVICTKGFDFLKTKATGQFVFEGSEFDCSSYDYKKDKKFLGKKYFLNFMSSPLVFFFYFEHLWMNLTPKRVKTAERESLFLVSSTVAFHIR